MNDLDIQKYDSHLKIHTNKIHLNNKLARMLHSEGQVAELVLRKELNIYSAKYIFEMQVQKHGI